MACLGAGSAPAAVAHVVPPALAWPPIAADAPHRMLGAPSACVTPLQLLAGCWLSCRPATCSSGAAAHAAVHAGAPHHPVRAAAALRRAMGGCSLPVPPSCCPTCAAAVDLWACRGSGLPSALPAGHMCLKRGRQQLPRQGRQLGGRFACPAKWCPAELLHRSKRHLTGPRRLQGAWGRADEGDRWRWGDRFRRVITWRTGAPPAPFRLALGAQASSPTHLPAIPHTRRSHELPHPPPLLAAAGSRRGARRRSHTVPCRALEPVG